MPRCLYCRYVFISDERALNRALDRMRGWSALGIPSLLLLWSAFAGDVSGLLSSPVVEVMCRRAANEMGSRPRIRAKPNSTTLILGARPQASHAHLTPLYE